MQGRSTIPAAAQPTSRRWLRARVRADLTGAERNQREVRQVVTTFGIAIAVGLACLGVAAGSTLTSPSGLDDPGWLFRVGRVLGAGALIGAASCLVGGLLGFLFGIPRTPVDVAPDASYRVNTNLEEISDWLTKILVGLGLTQIAQVGPLLFDFSTWAAPALGVATGGPVLVVAICVYFSIAGLLACYLITRMFLTTALVRAESEARQLVTESQIEATRALRIPLGPDDASLSASQWKEVADLARVPMEELRTPQELAAWARAQAATNDLQQAEAAYQRAMGLDPADKRVQVEFAQVLARSDRHDAAISQLESAVKTEDPVTRGRAHEELIFNYLYAAPPEGFTKAIEIGEREIGEARISSSARLWTYLAAAYGQKHAWMRGRSHDERELAGVRDAALDAVQKALKLSPVWKRTLSEMYDPNIPGRDPGEDDLTSFYPDPEFDALLT